jgi:hypothetical protein
MPWEADSPEEAYELWLAHVEAGADPNEQDWKGTI